MRTTKHLKDRWHPEFGSARLGRLVAVCCVAGAVLLTMVGCSGASSTTSGTAGSAEASAPVGRNMAGAAQDVIVSKAAIANRPKPWVLTSPESAVRSYLDWVSYAYRIGESAVATPTMSASQEVRVDSYTQLNLQNGKLLDQTLSSITFRKATIKGTRALLPVRENWTYRYVSIKTAGQTLEGPYSASYDTTYTVVKTKRGWVVDTVAVKPLGTVK